MPKSSKILLLAVSAALVLTIFLGINSPGVSAATTPQDGAYRQINVYSEVLRHIQSDYVTDPNIDAVTNGALRGLLETLDSDSSYLTPADYKTYKADRAGKLRSASTLPNASATPPSSPSSPAALPTRPASPTATSSRPSAPSIPATSPSP